MHKYTDIYNISSFDEEHSAAHLVFRVVRIVLARVSDLASDTSCAQRNGSVLMSLLWSSKSQSVLFAKCLVSKQKLCKIQ